MVYPQEEESGILNPVNLETKEKPRIDARFYLVELSGFEPLTF
jgi:hypothetical protein